MKFIGRLKDQVLEIQGLENNRQKDSYKKFLNNFFETFFTEIFTKDYVRDNFPILKSNQISIFDNFHSDDIYIIFVKNDVCENIIEFHAVEDYRYGTPTLIRTMLDCEITKGKVIFGLQISFSKLIDKSHTEEIVMDYINKHK